MKSIFVSGLLFFMTLAFTSCVKSGVQYRDSNIPSIKAALASHPWVYYEYFMNFNTDGTQLIWKKNRNRNSLDLSSYEVTYNDDGSYNETDEYGRTHSGTWNLLSETELAVKNSEDSTVYTIEELDSDRFEWSGDGDNYGIMVSKDQPANTTGSRLQMLTSQTWKYALFFDNYNRVTPTLSWKENKENNREDYSVKQVKFNTDGTLSEITWDGSTLDGTWTFVNGESAFQVVNSLGSWTSPIEVLNDDRFEWSNGTQYAEMVPLQ